METILSNFKEKSDQTKEKMSQKKQGSLNPNWNKPRSQETKTKISQSLKKYHEKLPSKQEIQQKSIYEIELPHTITNRKNGTLRWLTKSNALSGFYTVLDCLTCKVLSYEVAVYKPHQPEADWVSFENYSEALVFFQNQDKKEFDIVKINESDMQRIVALSAQKGQPCNE